MRRGLAFQRVRGAARGGGVADEARAWIARGVAAPQEPEWTDIDPSGRAFPYTPTDWARVAIAYADTGELIHPRSERGEPGISEFPDLPAAYAESAPYVSAAETGAPFPPIVDDGEFSEALQGADGETRPPRRRSGLLGRKR